MLESRRLNQNVRLYLYDIYAFFSIINRSSLLSRIMRTVSHRKKQIQFKLIAIDTENTELIERKGDGIKILKTYYKLEQNIVNFGAVEAEEKFSVYHTEFFNGEKT